MTYQQILLSYFRQEPFTNNPDPRRRLFEIQMMVAFMQEHIASLDGCISKLVFQDHEQMQSMLGFELGIAQVILEKIQTEHHELVNGPV